MNQPFHKIQKRLLVKYLTIVGAISLAGATVLYIIDHILNGIIVDFLRVLLIDIDPFAMLKRLFAIGLPLMIVITSFVIVYFLAREFATILKQFLKGIDDVYEKQREYPHISEEYDEIAKLILDSAKEYQQYELSAQEDEMKKKDLIYLLTQDIRLPLSNILMYIELLQKEKQISKPTRYHFMETILMKSMDLEDMINEFFDITRFNLHYSKWNAERFVLTHLIEQVIDEYYYLLDEKQMQVSFQYDEVVSIVADNEKIARVIRDLLYNLCMIGYEHSDIQLNLKSDHEYHHLIMEVKAIHLKGDSVANLFKNYYQLKEVKVNGRSHVLGLGIAKSIMDVAKGNLFASSIGETLKFDLYFVKEDVYESGSE